MAMRGWYVAKTKPRQEFQVRNILEQRGVRVFLPEIGVWRGPHSSRPTRLEPLFPGYLFVELDPQSPDWLVSRSAPGVAYFLGYQGVPTAVPAEVVAEIRRQAERCRRRGWASTLEVGQRVVITHGPLSGLEAVFAGSLSAAGRSRVLVEIVSRVVPVVIADKHLRKTG